MIRFPKGFYWGSASSATQTEGASDVDGKEENIWDYWYSIEPYKFWKEIGPREASGFYYNYEEDIKLLKKTGHNSYRTSISWSRLLAHGKLNEKAVKFYRDVFTKIKEEGITLFVNLYHFDMPLSLQNIGGWTNRKVVEYFTEYARTSYRLFGDLVDRWFTFNEPIVHVECGYINQNHYPMEMDPKKAVQVAFYTQLASSLAIEAIKKENKDAKVGIILNLTPAYPRSNNKYDLEAKEYCDLFQMKSFLEPSVLGYFPERLIDIIKDKNLLPEYERKDLDIIKNNRIDFLGVNYYQPLRVKQMPYKLRDDAIFEPANYYMDYDMPGKKINPYRGWEIYPQAIYDIAKNIQNNYGNIEWLISENGIGVEGEKRFKKDGIIQDDYRIKFFKDHLRYLHKAIEEGANCIGYQVWTFIDCWSWLNSYKNRYGLVELDLESKKRTLKKSAYWFKELSDNNGF